MESTLSGEWCGHSAGGNIAHPTWRDNEQYAVTVKQNVTLSIALTQHPVDKLVGIGFYVVHPPALRPGQPFRKVLHRLVRKDFKVVSEFVNQETVSLDIELHPLPGGIPWIIIPTTKRPGTECKFTLKATGSGPFDIHALTPEQNWNMALVKGKFDENTSGGCRHWPTWRKNPQYHIWVKKKTSCVIIMHQSEQCDDDSDQELCTIGFYLAKTTQMKRQKLTLWEKDLVIKSKFDAKRTVEVHMDLPASETPYVLIAATYDMDEFCDFEIRMYNDTDVVMEPVVGDPEWTSHTVNGSWTEATAGGNRSHLSWRKNDQYQLFITEPTEIIPVLNQNGGDFGGDFGSYLLTFGYYILRGTHPTHRALQAKSKQLFHTSRFDPAYEITTKKILEPCEFPYLIVPCTSEPGELGEYELTVWSDKPIEMKKISAEKDWQQMNFNDRIEGAFAGGAPPQPKWRDNKQFMLHIPKAVTISLFLSQEYDEDKPGHLAEIGLIVAKENIEVQTFSFMQAADRDCAQESLGAAGEGKAVASSSKVIRLDKKNTIATSTFSSELEVRLDVTLPGSEEPYMIMPCSKEPTDAFSYSLEIFSPKGSVVERASLPSELRKAQVHGNWVAETAGGCRHHATWTKNTQYRVSLPSGEATRATIILSQPEPTEVGWNHLCSIGMYLCHTQRQGRHHFARGRPVVIMPAEGILTKSQFANQQEVIVEVELDPAMTPYALVPTTYEPDELGEFTVTCYSETPVAIELFHQEDLWKCQSNVGSWDGLTAGGSNSYSTWRNNQQYLVQHQKGDNKILYVSVDIAKIDGKLFDSQIGFYVVSTGDGPARRWLGTEDKEHSLMQTVPFVTTSQVSFVLEDPPSDFIVVPTTLCPGVEYNFTINVFSDTAATIQPISADTDWLETKVSGTWRGSFGGDVDAEEFAQNPRFELTASQSAQVYVLLVSDELDPVKCHHGLVLMDTASKVLESGKSTPHSLMLPYEATEGNQILVPWKSGPCEAGSFDITIFSDVPVQLTLL